MKFGDNNRFFSEDPSFDSDIQFTRRLTNGTNLYTDYLLNKTLQKFIEEKDIIKI